MRISIGSIIRTKYGALRTGIVLAIRKQPKKSQRDLDEFVVQFADAKAPTTIFRCAITNEVGAVEALALLGHVA